MPLVASHQCPGMSAAGYGKAQNSSMEGKEKKMDATDRAGDDDGESQTHRGDDAGDTTDVLARVATLLLQPTSADDCAHYAIRFGPPSLLLNMAATPVRWVLGTGDCMVQVWLLAIRLRITSNHQTHVSPLHANWRRAASL